MAWFSKKFVSWRGDGTAAARTCDFMHHFGLLLFLHVRKQLLI